MNDPTVFEWARTAIVPAVTIITSVALFWLKLYSDARKRLDDLLIELEHRIYLSEERSKVFADGYLEIRKAATEFDRWIINPLEKRKLREALVRFRGEKSDGPSVFDLKGTIHEGMIDVFLTSSEIRCLSPHQSDYAGFIRRIADLRKVTGSRRWADPKTPVV